MRQLLNCEYIEKNPLVVGKTYYILNIYKDTITPAIYRRNNIDDERNSVDIRDEEIIFDYNGNTIICYMHAYCNIFPDMSAARTELVHNILKRTSDIRRNIEKEKEELARLESMLTTL